MQVAREDAREVTLHVALAADFSESGKLTATYSFEKTTHKCRDRDFVAIFARRNCERLRGESNEKGVRGVHVPKDADDYLDFNWVDEYVDTWEQRGAVQAPKSHHRGAEKV